MHHNLLNMKSENDLDKSLKMYREAHASVARYSIRVSNRDKGLDKIIKTGVTFEVAMKEASEFNKKAGDSFVRDICVPILENSEECRAAVKLAAYEYWGVNT